MHTRMNIRGSTHAPFLGRFSDETRELEWERPTFLRRPRSLPPVEPDLPDVDSEDWDFRSGLLDVHFRPLVWADAPTRPGNYYIHWPGETEYELFRVGPGERYKPGPRWCGPLPDPPRDGGN